MRARSSSVTVTDCSFSISSNTISVILKNTGTKAVTISQIGVNDANCQFTPSPTVVNIDATNIQVTIVYAGTLTSGARYRIELIDSNGQTVGAYGTRAPF